MLHLGAATAHPLRRSRGSNWAPAALGADLLAFWDAGRADLLTLSGGMASSWRDAVGGYDAVQAVGASRPVHGATSFGGRPGLSFDGVDDFLELASVPLPSGSTACEIWTVVDQTAPSSDNSTRCAFAYGGTSTNSARLAGRFVSGSANRLIVRTGSGAGSSFAFSNADLTGRHFLRCTIGPALTTAAVDGGTAASVAVVPATGTTRVRVGAQTTNAASQFWQGQLAAILVTNPLPDGVAAQLAAWCAARSL